MENKIIFELKEAIKSKYDLEIDEIKLWIPPKNMFWDYCFNAWILAKDLRKNPKLIAEELRDFIDSSKIVFIDSLETAWAYLNIKINKEVYSVIFSKLLSDYKNNWTIIEETWKGKRIVIDYIWVNVWKPLHIWHICPSTQWQVLVNLYKKLWYDVISDSHIWDWWIIFGKLITAYKLWGSEQELEKDAVEHLFQLYVKVTKETKDKPELEESFRNEFKKLAHWEKDSIEFWEQFTKHSIKWMQTQLDRLAVKADYNIWESFYEWLWLPKIENYPDLKYSMKDIVKELVKKNIATQNDDNSVWVNFDEETKLPSCILQKRDWTHWYLASDLACVRYRMENWKPEKIVYFVDVRQQLHLKQVFTISEKIGWLNRQDSESGSELQKENTKLIHAHNWFISLKDWAMSTREWKIIKLDKLLDEAEDRAKKIILEKRDDIKWNELNELSKIIGIGAIKYWYLKKSRETDVIFDWDEFMTFEGNSWPYIQYAYVRASRILENTDEIFERDYINYTFESQEEIELIKMINSYNDIVEETAQKNMPHILCKYSYELTKRFNTFYNSIHVLNEEDETKKISRLMLVKLFTKVLKESFEIIWITMPERM